MHRGDVFTVAQTEDGDIVGWMWVARNRVYFEEFNCWIKLPQGIGFGFNSYVEKAYRGRRVIDLIRNRLYRDLKTEGFKGLWGLVLKDNEPVIRSLSRFGWKEVGEYRFVKVMFMNFKFPPRLS